MTRFARLWQILAGPHPRIRAAEDRRGARLFAALMLCQILLVVVGLFLINSIWESGTGNDIWSDKDGWVVMAGAASILAAYGLLRSGLYRAGLALYIVVTAVVAVTAPFMPGNPEIGLLSTMIIPVLLTAMVASTGWVLLALVGVVGCSVTQLLAFSRRQIIEPRVVSLNGLIASMSRMLSHLIGENIGLRTVLDPAVGAVRVDPGLVEQMVVNLAVNARDAMPEGGTLLIETSRDRAVPAGAALDGAAVGDFVSLAVTDTGTGMSEEVRRHIFEPFFTTKPQGKGTGLGLATVYGAVKQSDGHIEVHSTPGKGTTCRIFLPLVADAAAKAGDPEDAAAMPEGKETILLVEDERVVRDLAIRVLIRLGYQVLHAASAEEALAMAKARLDPIHLLLTDVVLPGRNGRQLAADVAACHPEARVLFSSGYPRDIIAQHGILEEGISYLSKPYALKELARRVRSVLDGA